MTDLKNELTQNAYPGRGILLGRSADGGFAAIAYFIMGRSENSRNRIFEPDGQGLRTKAFDESKMADPSLVIYSPVRVLGNRTIVTNGDQTDTVYDFLKKGASFEDALRTRTFEPDPPLFTPRISGLVSVENDRFSYRLSILKSNQGNGASCLRQFFDYPEPVSGEGHFIHTYQCDGNPPPSFTGEPKTVSIGNNLDAFTSLLWDSLNPDNKISLFTRFIRLSDGKTDTRIINKNH